MRRSWGLGLLVLAFALPLSVSLDPPDIGVAPAAACSGIAYQRALPVPTGYPEPPPLQTLATNARALVYTDLGNILAWPPKETDTYRVLVDGRAVSGKPRAILPGLFAIEPSEVLAGGATVVIDWKDTSLKPTARYKVGTTPDDKPPIVTGGTTLTVLETRSSCESTRFRLKVPLAIADDSPVVVAVWSGPHAEGAPLSFAAWVPGSDAVEIGAPGPLPEITHVAIDAAGNRSSAHVARLAGEGSDAPPAGAPAMRERGTRRRLGCGKTR